MNKHDTKFKMRAQAQASKRLIVAHITEYETYLEEEMKKQGFIKGKGITLVLTGPNAKK